MTDKEENQIIIDKMNELAIPLRGMVIHQFSYIETIMDEIIRRMAIGNERDILKRKVCHMSVKKSIFDECLKRFEVQFNVTLEAEIKEEFNRLIEKRNILAHWSIDVSEFGIKYFRENAKLMFVDPSSFKSNTQNFEVIGKEEAIEIVKTTTKIQSTITSMLKPFFGIPNVVV